MRSTAEAALVQGAGRSLPLLRQFLSRRDEGLDLEAFEIIRRIGPPAIPLLVDLLRDERVSIRRNAADALIDLAPDTEWIQPALRRALKDEDPHVAGDAARALGALGKRASPSVARWSRPSRTRILTSASTRRRPWRPSARRRPRRQGARQSPARSDSRRSVGGVRGPRKHRPGRAVRRAAVDRSAEGRVPLCAHLRGRGAGEHRAEGTGGP